jgi:hypothetical protein
MAKYLIMYNLAEHITEEVFKKYVASEKGPLISSFSSVKKYELIKVSGGSGGKIPYQYVGIVDLTSLEEYKQDTGKDTRYQDFQRKFGSMVKDLTVLSGNEIY